MTGLQLLILIFLLVVSIFVTFYNSIKIGLILLIITLIVKKGFQIYNDYKRAEIEKEIYKDIKKDRNA